MIVGYRCPKCGNEIGYDTIVEDMIMPDDPVHCMRCDDGEYTDMDPIFDNQNFDDEY